MRPLREFPETARRRIRGVLCDIDDTLTWHDRLPAVAYAALERLYEAGLIVVPITGRPAGWCDAIARHWPVHAVVGENGAFYFRNDRAARRMVRRYWRTEAQRRADRRRLDRIAGRILAAVPGARIAADQAYREADLAIDFREDVPALGLREADRIQAIFEAGGAVAKISSIHVNGWFGDYDKLAMTRALLREVFDCDLDAHAGEFVFAGDSPNDAPMFAFFPNAVGVANLRQFEDRLTARPKWLTEGEGGFGFAELADCLLRGRPA
ncbi:MAG TPA: HAD-IIB family hydrolase [Thermohalobaculum sp.]|nr:HAD-IIB family hydrolase [Thermohalobaculum sp.]